MHLLKIYWTLLFLVFRKCTVHNMHYLSYYICGKNNDCFVGTILTDLSKAYDSYGVTKNSLKEILNYHSRRKQRTKISSSISRLYDIITGVPQGSIFGSLLFGIFVNVLLLLIKRFHVCNFADGNSSLIIPN